MRRQTETPGPSKGSSLPKQPGATRKCSDARGESLECLFPRVCEECCESGTHKWTEDRIVYVGYARQCRCCGEAEYEWAEAA